MSAFDLVRAHFRVLHEIVAAEAGAVVKTIGDAVMATFPTPDRALAAALRMREAMRQLNAERGGEDLLLKIGIHEGPCLAVMLNERQDYFGQTVNIASRVQGLAGSRSIFATGAVVEHPPATKLLARERARAAARSSARCAASATRCRCTRYPEAARRHPEPAHRGMVPKSGNRFSKKDHASTRRRSVMSDSKRARRALGSGLGERPVVERGKHGLRHLPGARLSAELAGEEIARRKGPVDRGADQRAGAPGLGDAVPLAKATRASWRPDRNIAVGLAMPRPAMSGAVPWQGWNTACSSPMSAEGAKPMPPMSPAPRSERMSPNMFSVTSTSKSQGRSTSCSAVASM